MSNCACSCGKAPKYVVACAGSADVGELSDRAARTVSKQGTAKHFCLTGVGGGLSGFIKSAEAAEQIVAIDGCTLNCASKTLEKTGLDNYTIVQLNALGLAKGESPANEENITLVTSAVADAVRT